VEKWRDFIIGGSFSPSSLTRDGDRIVVMSIHQPRYSIVKLFDTLTLLSLGKLIYHGESDEALSYFNELGECWESPSSPLHVTVLHMQASGVRSMTTLQTSTWISSTAVRRAGEWKTKVRVNSL
jgi:ABC-type multidrug transport system ATPase subunit